MQPPSPPVSPFKPPSAEVIHANVEHEKGLRLYRLSSFLFVMACLAGFGGCMAGAKLESRAVSIVFALFGCFSVVGAAIVGSVGRSKMKK